MLKISDNGKIIIVIILEQNYTECASGYTKDKVYTISLDEEKELTNEDIIKKYGYDEEKLLKDLYTFIQSNIQTDIKNIFEDKKDSLVYTIKNDKFIVGYEIVDGLDFYEYDGTSFKMIELDNLLK